MPALRLRPATEADLAWIAALEARPDMHAFIGGSSEDEHRSFLADPDFTQTLAEDADGAPFGYALTQGYRSLPGALLLRRIAVVAPEKGMGGAFLRRLIDAAFATGIERYTLTVFEDNARARAIYARLGFVDDAGAETKDVTRRDGTVCRTLPLVLYRDAWPA